MGKNILRCFQRSVTKTKKKKATAAPNHGFQRETSSVPMNEEEVKKVIISVTTDSTKTEGLVRRNSTGKSSVQTSPSLLNSNEKILPHYLRVSTKSCHDFCKYGKSHVFETKKRLPIRRSLPQSSSIRNEERNSAEVSDPRERRNSSDLKLNTTSGTEDGLSDKVDIKKLGLKEKESFEASECSKLQTSLLFNEGEESSTVLVSIETPSRAPIHQMEELSEASEMEKLESSSPTEKRIISQEPITPLAWSEGSSDGSASMELDSPSIHTPNNQVGKLSEEPLWVELSTPSPGIESMAFADEVAKSKSITKSLKAGSAMSPPSSNEERSSEKTSSVKLKTPPNHKSSTALEKQTMSKNLKVVEGKKRELTRPEVSDRTKGICKKRIESTMQSRIIKKSSSLSLVEKPKIVEQKKPSTMQKIMSVSPKIIRNMVPSSSNSIGTCSKPSISLKQKVPVVKSTPTLMSSRKPTAQKDKGSKIFSSIELPKPRASPSTKLPVGREKVKNQVKVGTHEHTDEKVKEKTLYIIEPKTLNAEPKPTNKEPKENKPTSSSHTRTASFSSSSSSSSRSTLTESKRSKPVRSPKRDEKRKPIRTSTIHSEPKLSSPPKLKFPRGKTVNPSTENNSPRKLKFRQAKGVSETPNTKEAVRKHFIRSRRVSIGSRAELNSPGLKAPAIVLKHQDVQEKKEIHGLFNHVIEETASKLVETRKSRVKALVSAFETVISLQENRVATSTS